jgi:hypothetical protein
MKELVEGIADTLGLLRYDLDEGSVNELLTLEQDHELPLVVRKGTGNRFSRWHEAHSEGGAIILVSELEAATVAMAKRWAFLTTDELDLDTYKSGSYEGLGELLPLALEFLLTNKLGAIDTPVKVLTAMEGCLEKLAPDIVATDALNLAKAMLNLKSPVSGGGLAIRLIDLTIQLLKEGFVELRQVGTPGSKTASVQYGQDEVFITREGLTKGLAKAQLPDPGIDSLVVPREGIIVSELVKGWRIHREWWDTRYQVAQRRESDTSQSHTPSEDIPPGDEPSGAAPG